MITVSFYLIASLGLFALSLLNVGLRERRITWMLSIPVGEGGHWLFLFSLTILAIVIVRAPPEWPVDAALILVSAWLFLRPLRSALAHERRWLRDLQNAFGGNLPKLVSFKTLFFGWGLSEVTYEVVSVPDVPLFHFYKAHAKKANVPFVVVVHGGGWDSGDPTQLPELNSWLSQGGFAVFAVSYRLLPKAVWPAPRDDVNTAIHYIRQNASRFGIDPDKWVILGRSAGAQIAGCVAYGDAAREQGCLGLILYYPCTDLTFGYEVAEEHDLIESRALLRKFLGGRPLENPSMYDDASFIERANGEVVPTLSIHGWPDRLCFYKHTERLHARLQYHGAKNASIILPWGQHGFDWTLCGPGGQISTRAVAHFLKQRFASK